MLITEKIDGTGCAVAIDRLDRTAKGLAPGAVRVEGDDHSRWVVRAASRTRWLTTERDNFGFAAWMHANAAALVSLGPGRHCGEWYGQGIRGGYGLDHRRFALFDADRWTNLPDGLPSVIGVVPVLARCEGSTLSATVADTLASLAASGSVAVPGQPAEGVVITSSADARIRFKAIQADAFSPSQGG